MGCMQSSDGAVKKNPNDRALSQVKFKSVGIKDFDGVFGSADDPINKVANINNSILLAQDNVFDAVLATAGMYYTVRLTANPANVIVYEVTDKKEKALSADEIAAHEILSKPYSVVAESIDAFNTLNVSSEEALEAEVENNRLVVKDSGMAKSAASVNNALFLLRQATRKAAGKEAMGFKDVLKEAAVVIKKGGSKPMIKPNMTKLQKGEIDFDVKLGKTGPTGQVQKLWDAIAGRKGLLESMKKAAAASTALDGDINGVKTKVDALPKSVTGISEKAKTEGLNPMQMVKAAKSMAANASKFSAASKYIPMLMSTLKSIAADLEEVFKGTPGADDDDETDDKVEVSIADTPAATDEVTNTDAPIAVDATAVSPVVEVATEAPVVVTDESAAVAVETEGAGAGAAVVTEGASAADVVATTTSTTGSQNVKTESAPVAVAVAKEASVAVE